MMATTTDEKYLLLLRRELVRAQARLKRAERERDELAEENRKLRALLKTRRGRARKNVSP